MSGESIMKRMSDHLLGQDISGEAAVKASKEGITVEAAADQIMIDLIAANPNWAKSIGTESFRYGLERGSRIRNPGVLRHVITGEDNV